jgi:mgtE-like transporter
MATMAFSLILISPITIAVSVISFRLGLDPDVIVYPVISTLADIIVTACYITMLRTFFFSNYIGGYLIGFIDIVFLSFGLYVVFKNLKKNEFIKTIQESLVTLILVSIIVNVTGSFLKEINVFVGDKPEIYVVYPALITTIGAVGSIVGSTATTKLFLGVITPSFTSIKNHLSEIGGAWGASTLLFILYSLISSSINSTNALNPLIFTKQLIITNIIAVSIMVFLAYLIAIFTYRKGWDPDNFVIPLESSLADCITTISLLTALKTIS